MPQKSTLNFSRKTIYNAGIESTTDYVTRSNVRERAPKIKLTINPFLPPLIPIDFFGTDLGDLIVSAQWYKNRNEPGGHFTITFVPDDESVRQFVNQGPLKPLTDLLGASLRDVFKPMTLARLEIDGYHIMTGYLKSFRKTTNPNGQMRYTAVFDELGQLYTWKITERRYLQNGDDDADSWLSSNEAAAAFNPSKMLPLGLAIKKQVDFFIKSTLNYGLSGYPTPWFTLSDGLPLAARLLAQFASLGGISLNTWMTRLPLNLDYFTSGGSFWDYLTALCPSPWMECFTESGGRTICTGSPLLLFQSNPDAREADLSSVAKDPYKVSQDAVQKSLSGLENKLTNASVNVSPLVPGFSHLIVRSAPYANPMTGLNPYAGSILTATELGVFDLMMAGDFVIGSDLEVVSKDLGTSIDQQYTYFDVPWSVQAGSFGTMVNRPAVAQGPNFRLFPGGVRTYGDRVMSQDVSPTNQDLLGLGSQVLGDSWLRTLLGPVTSKAPNVSAFTVALALYYRNAAKYMEGSFVLEGKAYAKPGMLYIHAAPFKDGSVTDSRELGMYYIDAVNGNYDLEQKDFTTTLSVIRGTPFGFDMATIGRLLMEWETYTPTYNTSDGEIPYGKGVGAESFVDAALNITGLNKFF